MAAAIAPNTYDADLTGASFDQLLANIQYVIDDNPGLFKYVHTHSVKFATGGLKNMRVYRGIFNTRYLYGKTPVQRAGFIIVVFSTSVVQTKSRCSRVINALPDTPAKRSANLILQDFKDTRRLANDADSFMIVNLRTAYPELIMIARIVNTELQAERTITKDDATTLTRPGWYFNPCMGQLAIDDAAQDEHMSYMRYFWTQEVSGAGAVWNTESETWYGRTTASDNIMLPEVYGCTCAMTGTVAGSPPNSRYTITDICNYATDVYSAMLAAGPLADTNVFHS